MSFRIPAFCPQCNAFYPSGFALDRRSRTFMDHCASICPKGHITSVLDGAFDVRDGVLTITDEAGTEPVLERIRKMAEDALGGKTDPAATIDAIGELVPSLKPILKAFGKSNSLMVLGMLLWFVVEMTKAFHPSGSQTSTSHIEYGPTTINQITIDQSVSADAQFAPTDRSISDHKSKNSKRKKRRARAKATH